MFNCIQTVNKGIGKMTDRKFINTGIIRKRSLWVMLNQIYNFYVFCCFLYGTDEMWAKKGRPTKDAKHLTERIISHELSTININNEMKLAMLGLSLIHI